MALFGTDGVRGVANQKLTPELAFQIGQAAGRWLKSEPDLPSKVVIGRDTRRSGPMLGAAVAAGFCSTGVDAQIVGIVPTGCISHACRFGGFGLGVVISASHNPAPDNGIKLLAHTGKKASGEVETFIESHLGIPPDHRPTGDAVGQMIQDRTPVEAYVQWLISLVPQGLSGMKVAIDGSNGAAYELGMDVFRRLGAEIVSVGINPDGMNINAGCGATHPQTLQELTRESNAVFGVAFDGDADRAVFADSHGRLINGDRTMGIWCVHRKTAHDFDPPVVVGTVMSNGGFESHLRNHGIRLERVEVGDKYVSARLDELSGRVGGEQSGHIIFRDLVPTGDGLVTALEFAKVLRESGKTAAEAYEGFENWPQLLVNLQVDRKDGWADDPNIQRAISDAEEQLAGQGRLSVRASGTQPILRVMVESESVTLRDDVSNDLVAAILSELGGSIYSRVDLTHALGD